MTLRDGGGTADALLGCRLMAEIYRSPWFDLEGYLACTVKYDDGSRRTVLQHREVLEGVLGRTLLAHEHVHHKDENRRNNDPLNLEVKDRVAHGKHHAEHAEVLVLVCAECGSAFAGTGRTERRRLKLGRSGPYCGKSCVGTATRKLQIANGRSNLRAGVAEQA